MYLSFNSGAPIVHRRYKNKEIIGAKNFRCQAIVRRATAYKPVWNVRAYPAYVAGNRKGIFW